jgi:hypothetical protein
MPKRTIAAMVVMEIDDPRLFPENFDTSTERARRALSSAVRANLRKVQSVVMVMPEEAAKLMVTAHSIAAQGSGLDDFLEEFPNETLVPPHLVPGYRRHH